MKWCTLVFQINPIKIHSAGLLMLVFHLPYSAHRLNVLRYSVYLVSPFTIPMELGFPRALSNRIAKPVYHYPERKRLENDQNEWRNLRETNHYGVVSSCYRLTKLLRMSLITRIKTVIIKYPEVVFKHNKLAISIQQHQRMQNWQRCWCISNY
jgi:hypothetical protein